MPGRPTKIWIIVGQGPIAIAVGLFGIFLSSIFSLFFSFSRSGGSVLDNTLD